MYPRGYRRRGTSRSTSAMYPCVPPDQWPMYGSRSPSPSRSTAPNPTSLRGTDPSAFNSVARATRPESDDSTSYTRCHPYPGSCPGPSRTSSAVTRAPPRRPRSTESSTATSGTRPATMLSGLVRSVVLK